MAHDNWQTPPALLDAVRAEFGQIDLDAAASAENAVCSYYINEERNALETDWTAPLVWCNPPYSKLPAFTFRAWREAYLGHASQVLLLIPAYTDTQYWAEYVTEADEIRFLTGRLRFWENGVQGRDTARFPSALVIFNHHRQYLSGSPRHTYWDWRHSRE